MSGSFVWSLSFSVIPSVCLWCDYSFTGYLSPPPHTGSDVTGLYSGNEPMWHMARATGNPSLLLSPLGKYSEFTHFPFLFMHLHLPPIPCSFPYTRVFFSIFNNLFFFLPRSRQSAKLFLQSLELGLPYPLTSPRGERGPNSDAGTYTVVLYVLFIRSVLCVSYSLFHSPSPFLLFQTREIPYFVILHLFFI
jgi:hypothetical protein